MSFDKRSCKSCARRGCTYCNVGSGEPNIPVSMECVCADVNDIAATATNGAASNTSTAAAVCSVGSAEYRSNGDCIFTSTNGEVKLATMIFFLIFACSCCIRKCWMAFRNDKNDPAKREQEEQTKRRRSSRQYRRETLKALASSNASITAGTNNGAAANATSSSTAPTTAVRLQEAERNALAAAMAPRSRANTVPPNRKTNNTAASTSTRSNSDV